MALMGFDDALQDSQDQNKRHLLLGNGFSIACRPDAFSYGRLLDAADFSRLTVDAGQLFRLSGTSDFERVIEMLRAAATVLALYAEHEDQLLTRLRDDAERVRDALAEVLVRKHLDHVYAIEREEYGAAHRFLSRFDGNIYTVNYDLLLYWAPIQDDIEPAVRWLGFQAAS
jgi:hypothetical protein